MRKPLRPGAKQGIRLLRRVHREVSFGDFPVQVRLFAARAKRIAGRACHFPLFVAGFVNRRNGILFSFSYVSLHLVQAISHSPNMSKEDAHG